MNETDRQSLLRELRETQAEFIASLDSVTEAEASRKASPYGWTILQLAEHVAHAEGLMLRLVTRGQPSAEPLPNREESIRLAARNRAEKLVAPEIAHPPGKVATVAEAIDQFVAARGRTVQYVESCSADLRQLASFHPMLGPASSYECLLYLIAHPARHAEQIREIRRAAVS